MDARRRLFALFIALFCAMGWAPTVSARVSEDRVVAGESRGVLPGRPPEAPVAEPSADGHHDEPAALPPAVVALSDAAGGLTEPAVRADIDRRLARSLRPSGPRGPPGSR